MSADRPYLSVVIPTRDRADVLARTIAALAKQDAVEGGFEVVVADNGSGADTKSALDRARQSQRLQLRVVEEPRRGPAAARNAASAAAAGEVLLLLGDDTEPATEELLASHAALHRAHPSEGYACLGRIEWTPRTPVTDFMRWLDNGGPQFHFHELAPGAVSTEDHFYSSHLSLKRSALERAGGFDDRFPYAAVEDTDVGARLADQGVRLHFHPELVVWHDHPTTIAQSLARTERVGRSAALYNRIRTDRPHARVREPRGAARLLAPIATPSLGALARVPLPFGARRAVWSLAHRSAFATGYLKGPPTG
ncbi:MAG TPA: glycosyltransferase [Solirubrobacterales bacterium]